MPLRLVSAPNPSPAPRYVELHARSAFSLLGGASTPERLVAQAAALGVSGLALLDRDDLGGAVRLHRAAEEAGIRPIYGATLTLEGDMLLPVLVESRQGWAHLCELISAARMSHPRGAARTTLTDLEGRTEGLFALTGGLEGPLAQALLDDDEPRALERLSYLQRLFGRDHLAVEVWRHGLPFEHRITRRLITLANRFGLRWVPTGDVHYAAPEDRCAHDVLTCLRHSTTLDEAGSILLPNDQWHMRSPQAMASLWRDHPGALERTLAVAEQCAFQLDQLRPELPRFQPREGGGSDDNARLAEQVWSGAKGRYGDPLSAGHCAQLSHELAVIARLGLAGYFLIVADIVRFARGRDILVQGRGSAANSAVCYCLEVTAIDPIGMDLLFERFLSESRTDPPDIDLDIAHQRREEVLQYVYRRYGRRHTAMVCTTITWRGKSALRDVARVLGLDVEVAARLAAQVGRCEASEAADLLASGGLQRVGLDPGSPRVRALLDVVRRLDRLPRHRAIHTGGFVLTAEPLTTVTAIEPASMADRTVIQWDKDDLGPVGLVKIDLLGLGILTVLDAVLRLVSESRGVTLELGHLPMDDAAVYDQICAADTIGLFQIESRAQMQSLPRLRPRRFYDLVVQVALIRPGPIQGEMVHPYIRRRRGEEPVTYLHPALEPVLARTLGVPLFQEQGMKVAIVMAGFTPGQADRLRKLMGFKRAHDMVQGSLRDLWDGMMARGVCEETALRIVHQLEGFASYGFPESHAASFALLTYASAYLRHHFHPEYLVAMLNAQPMGFYAPATLVQDARRHGVEVRPVDVVFSTWDNRIEVGQGGAPVVRLGLRQVRGLSSASRAALQAAMEGGPLGSLDELVHRADQVGVRDHVLVTLARAGGFRTLWPGRREALWEVLKRLRERHMSLDLRTEERAPTRLPSMSALEETRADYATLGLSHRHHPMTFHRASLDSRGVLGSSGLACVPHGQVVRVAGIVICRQRPGSAKGVLFMTLEDEDGMINVVVMPDVFHAHRLLIATTPALEVRGTLERQHGVLNVLGTGFTPLPDVRASIRSRQFR
jgi:error-prone DNA polymerase